MDAYQIDIDSDSDDELGLRVPNTSLSQQDVVQLQVQLQFDKDFADAKEKHEQMSVRKAALTENGNAEPNDEAKKSIATDYGKFVKERCANWNSTTFEGRNFLHYLAYKDSRLEPPPKWLIQSAIASRPELMCAMDSKKRTPLTAAIVERNVLFCHNAVNLLNFDRSKSFWGYLRTECQAHDHGHDREITCLHAALTANFYYGKFDRKKFITRMISLVPEEMFTVVDSRGRTPLHLAVQYENCTASQVDIVEQLLDRGPQALDIEIQTPGSKYPLSIYQFHEESKRNAKYEARNTSSRGDQDRRRHQMKSIPDAPKTELKEAGNRGKFQPMDPPPRPFPKDKAEANISLTRRSSGLLSGYENHETTRISTGVDMQLASSYQVGLPPKGAPQVTDGIDVGVAERKEEQERSDAAREISEKLKLLCLRSRRPDQVSRILRIPGNKRDKVLWFDFGPRKKLSESEFCKTFNHLEFESILQYVAFPHVDLVTDEGNPPSESRSRVRRNPMVVFFDWLRNEERGVKRIIKVIVDDLDKPSHTDEAIEQALTGFDVEILDWRRPDICPLSLQKIGQSLREINLYWSGRNSVLRSWSEAEGLPMLPALEVVNIIETGGMEEEERTLKNLAEFKKRVYDKWPSEKRKPIIHPPDGTRLKHMSQRGSSQHAEMSSGAWQGRTVDPHRWMECMKKFSEEFRRIKELGKKQRHGYVSSRGPVVVALIDDGTDISHPDLSDQKEFNGCSFHQYQEGSMWRVSPWWHSSSGHGTLMARLIAGICPSAIIHVIKLHTFEARGTTKLQIDPDSAVRAIRYATELKADIISMSWTIKPPTEPVKLEFDNAVHLALNGKNRALMFCAASDQGKFADRTYPHRSNPSSFRIGAAAATGKIMDTVGDADDLNFIFPGHEVVVDNWYDDVKDASLKTFEAHTGSSVATALAAGLAALIMECVRLGVVHTNETPGKQQDATVAIRAEDLVSIKDRDTMKSALLSIGTDINTRNLYLEVWRFFEDKAKKLEEARLNCDPEGQLEIIAGLARNFLRKGA